MKVLEKQACHVMLRDQLSFIDFRGDHMVLWLNRSGIICRQKLLMVFWKPIFC